MALHVLGSTQPCTASQLSPCAGTGTCSTVALGAGWAQLCEGHVPRSFSSPTPAASSLFPLEVSSHPVRLPLSADPLKPCRAGALCAPTSGLAPYSPASPLLPCLTGTVVYFLN